jgi:hypothetical protein
MIMGSSNGSETEREVRQILDLVPEQEMNINILWGCTVPPYMVTPFNCSPG